jgi:hypothetical protein
MSATPDFPITGRITITTPLSTANTAMDGTGTVEILGTAGSAGAYLYKVQALGTGTNSTTSVLRIFLNNGGTTSTASNNILIGELLLSPPGTLSHIVAQRTNYKNFDIKIPPTYRITAALGNGVSGSAGWAIVAFMVDS